MLIYLILSYVYIPNYTNTHTYIYNMGDLCNTYVTYIHTDIHTEVLKTIFTLGRQYVF